MTLNNPLPHQSSQPTQVSRVRRPLHRAYLALGLLFVAALIAVVLVTLLRRAPSINQYAVGWFFDDGQSGRAYELWRDDSPVQAPSISDEVGYERQLLALLNKARLDRGLAPLRLSETLTRAARAHAKEMAESQQFDLFDARGQSPLQRAEGMGYSQPQTILEVIGAGYQRPHQVLGALIGNSDTASNLLSREVAEIGIGYAFSRDDKIYHHYWSAVLGRRSGLAYTIVVNDGNESTLSPQVVLHIGGKGWAYRMQVSNSPDFAGAKWEPFAAVKTWKLSNETGPKQVYVKLRGVGDEEMVVVGQIALITAEKSTMPWAIQSDAFAAPRPPNVRAPADSLLAPASANVPAPGYYQTSEFMLGQVAVGIVMPQCSGVIDRCTETWTPTAKDEVIQQITAGLNWWSEQLHGRVTFVLAEPRQVSTAYEPINHPQSDEGLWIGDVMANLGFGGSNYFERVYAYNNWLRQQQGADWAFTLFVANSANSQTGTFTSGHFAYAYMPGPFVVTTYDNDGYRIENMAAVIAHQTGHLFGALDQHASANVPCTATGGYLAIQNQNSQQSCATNQDSIMRGGIAPYTRKQIDPFALEMVGYRVSSANALPDPINTTPTVTLNSLSSPTTQRSLTISGIAQDQPFLPPSSEPITINYITGVQYRVDGGAWQNATPSDGSASFNKVSQGFAFTLTLTEGAHTVEVRAINRVNNVSQVTAMSVTVQGAIAEPTPTPQP